MVACREAASRHLPDFTDQTSVTRLSSFKDRWTASRIIISSATLTARSSGRRSMTRRSPRSCTERPAVSVTWHFAVLLQGAPLAAWGGGCTATALQDGFSWASWPDAVFFFFWWERPGYDWPSNHAPGDIILPELCDAMNHGVVGVLFHYCPEAGPAALASSTIGSV